jgi:hypothetical protein
LLHPEAVRPKWAKKGIEKAAAGRVDAEGDGEGGHPYD